MKFFVLTLHRRKYTILNFYLSFKITEVMNYKNQFYKSFLYLHLCLLISTLILENIAYFYIHPFTHFTVYIKRITG